MMYSAAQLLKGLKNPELLEDELRDVPFRAHNWFARNVLGKDGADIMAEDWDNLLVLDACRFDMFRQLCRIDGELRAVISPGSSTAEFVAASFRGRSFPDTVYVSGNAQLEQHGVVDNFYAFDRVWIDGWCDELFTVRPETMADAAMAANDEYPHKRLIVHFVQPHYPFIGPKGQAIDHRGFTLDGTVEEAGKHKHVWAQLRDGEIGVADVWEAYVENLEIALPHVAKLCEALPGKTVVTSDHGNTFGRWSQYGHPPYRFIHDLVTVPWLEVPCESRKNVVAGSMADHAAPESDDEIVDDRLRALGYTAD